MSARAGIATVANVANDSQWLMTKDNDQKMVKRSPVEDPKLSF